jgi:hypothetical protein
LLMIAAEWGQEEDCEGKGRQNNKKNVDWLGEESQTQGPVKDVWLKRKGLKGSGWSLRNGQFQMGLALGKTNYNYVQSDSFGGSKKCAFWKPGLGCAL